MQLKYRGIDYTPQILTAESTEATDLTYRGVTYRVDPNQESMAASIRNEQLNFMGQSYMAYFTSYSAPFETELGKDIQALLTTA